MAKRRTWAFLSSLPLLSACAGILGIEQANHDEKLDPGGGTGGKSSGGTGGTAGQEDAGNPKPKTLCDDYCDAVLRNCNATHSLYASRDACMGVCATLPEGAAGDDSGNSTQCRLHYANSAGSVGELDINCPAAGPGGDGICGTNCEGFCAIGLAACASRQTVVTVDSCAGLCARIPDNGGYDASIQKGNTVQCRLYHASAATLDPDLHCPHVAGLGPCSPTLKP